MEIMPFTGKELATQEKSVYLFQFQYHSYNGSETVFELTTEFKVT